VLGVNCKVPLVIELGTTRGCDRELVKTAALLAKLADHKSLKIPFGFITTSRAFSESLELNRDKVEFWRLVMEEGKLDLYAQYLPKASAEIGEDLEEEVQTRAEERRSEAFFLIPLFSSPMAIWLTPVLWWTHLGTVSTNRVIDALKGIFGAALLLCPLIQRRGISCQEAGLTVVIEELVQVESGGLSFSCSPGSRNCDSILINSNWGSPETVMRGDVTPDEIFLERNNLEIRDRKTSRKTMKVIWDYLERQARRIPLVGEEAVSISLSEDRSLLVAKTTKEVESRLGEPVELTWGIKGEELWIFLVRPLSGV
jgi:phosphoenolpyruvate synthase/pyruvate phosphate dikinase